MSAISIMRGVGMDPEFAEVPCGTKEAEGNDIHEGASDASIVGSTCVPNVGVL